jgi:predicted Zn-dependent protease
VEDINMIQVEAFQEFRAGLTFLRGGDANKALPHLKCALEEEPANPFYISYMGVALAATEQKWAEAEELCRSAIRMSRRQAQLYLNLAEVYVTANRTPLTPWSGDCATLPTTNA